MQYTDITLFGLGMAGILLHNLIKINTLKREGREFKAINYFGMEWPTICISLIVILIGLVCKKEIKELDNAGMALGLGFVLLGYAGQSVVITYFGKASKKLGLVDPEQPKQDEAA